MVENDKPTKNRLRVRRVVDVPLREVSGICLRRGRNGRMSLIAVGDRVAKIAWFFQPRSDGGQIDWHTAGSTERACVPLLRVSAFVFSTSCADAT